MTGTDWATLADRLDDKVAAHTALARVVDGREGAAALRDTADDLRAAAVGLRRLAQLEARLATPRSCGGGSMNTTASCCGTSPLTSSLLCWGLGNSPMVERQITRAMLRRSAVNGYRQVRAMPRAVRLTSGQANHIRRAMGLRERTEP